jgi:hypothetical protein
MKTVLNIIFVVLLSSVMLALSFLFYMCLFSYMSDRRYSVYVYWGWFNWSTVFGWTPRLFFGFISGICISLLVFGRRPQLWSLITGFIMMVGGYYIWDISWGIKPTIMQLIFSNIWPMMYLIGAYFGEKLVSSIRQQLTR